MQNVKNEIYIKYCENLDYDVVVQKLDGEEKCLSSRLCEGVNCKAAEQDTKINEPKKE